MYIYKADVVRVIDGDTAILTVSLGFYLKAEMSFRLAGIDTAELNSTDPALRELAQKAKAYLEDKLLCNPRPLVTIHTEKADKYGRWLATIYYKTADGIEHCLNQELLDTGLAKKYP